MPTDFTTLLRRDHTDLQKELTLLLDPTSTIAQLRGALDGVRLGLISHVEAEDIVLGPYELDPALQMAIGEARAAHLTQEAALAALVTTRPGTTLWRERANRLRELVHHHAYQEETYLLPVLRQHLAGEAYARLAGAFATERLRQLAMLQPSAPVFTPFVLAEARA